MSDREDEYWAHERKQGRKLVYPKRFHHECLHVASLSSTSEPCSFCNVITCVENDKWIMTTHDEYQSLLEE